MKILLSLFSITALIVTTLVAANLFLPESSLAQVKAFDRTKQDNNVRTNKDYTIGERLKPKAQSQIDSQNLVRENSKDQAGAAISFKTISWDDLIPADWDPSGDFKNIDLGNFNDADPRAMAALQKLRKAWDNAPTNPMLNQKHIKIPGFVVPLDTENGKVAAFLLVPYFGGCLHTPPPPANQIIEVQLEQAQMIKSMEPVWVSGQLESVRSQTELGTAGYRLNAVKVTPYKETKAR